MKETVEQGFEAALHHPEAYQQLRMLALALAVEGFTPSYIYDLFEQHRIRLREMRRYNDEDVVMDCMDCIVGWCSPHERLFDPPPLVD